MFKYSKLYGAIALSIALTGCGGSDSGEAPAPQVDNIAPVISLTGEESVSIFVGQKYEELGANVTDNIDKAPQLTIEGDVDTSKAGTYKVTYVAIDAAGNRSEKVRTVIVKLDDVKPVVTIAGGNAVSIKVGAEFTPPTVTAKDNVDGDLTVSSEGDVDVNTAGTYTITYTATDKAGNKGQAILTVTVVAEDDGKDTTAPVITLPTSSTVYVNLGESFTIPTATATDDVDDSVAVTHTGTVDTNTIGSYRITYTAVDKAGNKATRILTVIVRDNAPLPEGDYIAFGAGNVSTKLNPAGFDCTVDHGHWIHGAGVVLPGVAGCTSDGKPIGEAAPVIPQVTGPAAAVPVQAHRWWGSLSFLGEMQLGNPDKAAYITPDPMLARVSNTGVRILSIPSGLRNVGEDIFQYQIPDPFAETFDGVSLVNTQFNNLEGKLKQASDGAVTVEWQSQDGQPVMEATFVHGSPYAYFKVFQGDVELRTYGTDGTEKGVSYQPQNNTLGIWTSVAGNRTEVLIVGEGETEFTNVSGDKIGINNAAKEFTLVMLPNDAQPIGEKVAFYAPKARNVVNTVDIAYAVDRQTNDVTVTHKYLGEDGQAVDTIAGLFPMAWKNSDTATSSFSTRSARGVIKYAATDSFSYEIPFIGVLPYMPSNLDTLDVDAVAAHIDDFIAKGEENWLNEYEKDGVTKKGVYADTYWAGKIYGQVAELAALADSLGLAAQNERLTTWLKLELEDWFTANTTGDLDSQKYFYYDKTWNTLLGIKESFLSHQQLNDHHFHYGYFVRAAAEICRQDVAWCGDDQYGPMIDLLIRDYAADKGDNLFPYMRHFDPANGFSWASGMVNFARGNNNESTSEAANAYGAMVLYGLATGKEEIVDRGMYMHASTTNSFWEYWNNIDAHTPANNNTDKDNFPPSYNRMTTSIIWGDGATFSTWFSPKFTHILGIQGLPSNPLSLHLAQHNDYMTDYIALGLSQAGGKPSGLGEDEWRDIWWNITAMHDADSAISDYNGYGKFPGDYIEERGSSKAHTYHWLHTWKDLGHLVTEITADHPAAVVFEKAGTKKYAVYNYDNAAITVKFSDGKIVEAAPNGFTVQ
ncbi:immunoglobulin-like domain-containing protein [Vibrio agarilyticus]|uniref:immunoglobulin-like domain-containing protein n=1 Tax=Vibrio agarilyticus TaxID=2726741 RepID=UPI001B3B1C00|nr:immunoglobulin-like domain-containing protein [Vibrio agarilyticus]